MSGGIAVRHATNVPSWAPDWASCAAQRFAHFERYPVVRHATPRGCMVISSLVAVVGHLTSKPCALRILAHTCPTLAREAHSPPARWPRTHPVPIAERGRVN